MPNIPTNKKLYNKIKSETKRKFKVWPSAYASGWLVKEYKKRGGNYKSISKSKRKSRRKSISKSISKSRRKSTRKSIRKSTRKSRRKSTRKSRMRFSQKNKSGLSRWFAEEWIDVCKLPRIVKCGRKNSRNSKRMYPYCRPRYKITSKSPRIARSLSRNEIIKRCAIKRKYPYKKVYSDRK